METNKTVNILGVEYSIIFRKEDERDPKLEDAGGYCEPISKKLVVKDFVPDNLTVECPDEFKKKVLRHEMVHAFFHECGLRGDEWGDNESLVDWLALQAPKLFRAMRSAGAL